MGKVTFDMSVSVDGFIAGPNMNPEQGLGEGVDSEVIGEALASPGRTTHRSSW